MIDYELLPYHRFGLGKYLSLGEVYELDDYKTPSAELVAHLQAIIDEAFGRTERRARRENRLAFKLIGRTTFKHEVDLHRKDREREGSRWKE